MGLTGGFLDGTSPDGVRPLLDTAREAVQREQPQLWDSINTTGQLSDEDRTTVAQFFRQLLAQQAR